MNLVARDALNGMFSMPEMFDWIFFAIVIPIPAFLVWDNMRNTK